MLNIHSENIGDIAIVECEGTLSELESANRLRNAVTSKKQARVIVIDLSKIRVISGFGVDMMLFLQRWTYDRRIELKFFNPSTLVKTILEKASSFCEFDFPALQETMAILAGAQRNNRAAA